MYLVSFVKDFDCLHKQLAKENSKHSKKLMEMILQTIKEPFTGYNYEALKHNLSGYHSKRITDKHRLIYMIKDNIIVFISCFGHYSDK